MFVLADQSQQLLVVGWRTTALGLRSLFVIPFIGTVKRIFGG
jgi:hypothetical protein